MVRWHAHAIEAKILWNVAYLEGHRTNAHSIYYGGGYYMQRHVNQCPFPVASCGDSFIIDYKT